MNAAPSRRPGFCERRHMHTISSALLHMVSQSSLREEYLECMRQAVSRDQDSFNALMAAKNNLDAAEKPLLDLLTARWSQAIEQAQDQGLLRPRASLPGNTPYEDAWDEMMAEGWKNIPDYRRQSITSCLVLGTINRLYKAFDNAGHDSTTIDSLAAEVEQEILTGTTPRIRGGDDGLMVNYGNGEAIWLELRNWTPHYTEKGHKGGFIPPKGLPNGRAFHTTIDVPSGRLLVADCISLGDFHSRLVDAIHNLGLNINYAWHRVVSTHTLARYKHTIQVYVGSDGPGMAQGSDGGLFAARPQENFPKVANICHDVWATTIVDWDYLRNDLVKHGYTITSADQAINSWLSESRYRTLVDVPPGTWHLVWDDDGVSVAKAFQASSIDAPEGTAFALLPSYKENIPGIFSI